MWDNSKGQVIIPTGGGKTMCMIEDVMTNMNLVKRGQTFVVVAPRILLAEQLCNEFLEVIPDTHTHIMHVHSGDVEYYHTTNPRRFICSPVLLALLVRIVSSSPHTTPCIRFSRQTSKSIPFTSMKHTTV